jgi:hypothetical protein
MTHDSAPRSRTVRHGLVAGLSGFVVATLVLGVVSAFTGRSPFYLPALLGGQLFFGRGAEVILEPRAILGFSAVHFGIFAIAGMFMAWVARASQRAPQGWYLWLSLVLYVGAHVIVVPALFGEAVQAEVSLWLVTAATTAAAIAMGAVLWKAYPGIGRGMHEPDEPAV